MIRGFKCRETEKIFRLEVSTKIPLLIQKTALRKLKMLHRSKSLTDLWIPPANRLEKLHGDRAGSWSIRINQQWRICFKWNRGDAYEVEIVDYH